MKIRQVGVEFFFPRRTGGDRQTNGWTDKHMTKLIMDLRYFANAPKEFKMSLLLPELPLAMYKNREYM